MSLKKSFRVFAVLSCVFAGLFISCDDDTSPTGTSDTSPKPSSATYFLTDEGTIFGDNGSSFSVIRKDYSCEDSVFKTETDTTKMTYRFSGDTLIVTDTSSSDSVSKLKRIGEGSGLPGIYQIIEWGESSDSSEAEMMKNAQIYINQSKFQVWMKKSAFSRDLLSGDDSTGIDNFFTIDTSSTGAIKITGKKTSEVVTLTFQSDGKIRWTSSNPARTPVTINYINPTSCNEIGGPDWLMEFMFGNLGLTGFTKKK